MQQSLLKDFGVQDTPTQPVSLLGDFGITDEVTQGFGKRADGTKKGLGYFGVLKTPDGGVATEYSIGVGFDGKEVEIPTLVPTLNQAEIDHLLKRGASKGLGWDKNDPINQSIFKKAVDHARKRIAEGKSPFAQENEQPSSETSLLADFGVAKEREKPLMGAGGGFEENIYDVIGSTIEAIPRVVGATAGSLALFPVAGLMATKKLIETGSLEEANKKLENVMELPGKLIETPEQAKAIENLMLVMKPIEMAGEGWRLIGEQINNGLMELGLESTYIEPLLATYGEAATVFALPGVIKKLKNSTAFRRLDIPERAIVTEQVAKWHSEGIPEAELLRKLGPKSELWKEALEKRGIEKTEAKGIAPEVETVKPVEVAKKPEPIPIKQEVIPGVEKAVPEAVQPITPPKVQPPVAPVKGEKKPYFTVKKAQDLVATITENLTDAQLQKHMVKLRDYNRYINEPEVYGKHLVEGGYYVSARTDASTGVVPKDMWLHTNLRYALDETLKEIETRTKKPTPIPAKEPVVEPRGAKEVLEVKETIEGVAIKVGDKIYEGSSHPIIADKFNLDMKKIKDSQLGFITNTGRYVERPEASRIAGIPKTQFDITAEELVKKPEELPTPKVTRVGEVTEAKEKQPWEMTRDEYVYGENQLSKFTPEKWKEQFDNISYPKEGKIKIYRGAWQKDRKHLKPGDWVTLDKGFAKENYAGPEGEVLSKEVPLSELMVNETTSQPGKSELIWKPEVSLETYNKEGKYEKLVDKRERQIKQAISEGKITSHPDYPDLKAKAVPEKKVAPKEPAKKVVTERPTVLIKMEDGTVYSSPGVHAQIVEEYGIDTSKIVDTGMIDLKTGKKIWKGGKKVRVAGEKLVPPKDAYSYENDYSKTIQLKKNTAEKGDPDNSKWVVEASEENIRALKGEIKDLIAGHHVKRKKTVDLDGTERWTGASSSYPEWFRNQGWTGIGAIAALKKANQGKPLGIRQAAIVEAAIEYLGETETAVKHRVEITDTPEFLFKEKPLVDPEVIAEKLKKEKDPVANKVGDRDWIFGKYGGEIKAAQRYAKNNWPEIKSRYLKRKLDDPANTVYLTVPGSSGKNMQTYALAEKIKNDIGGEVIEGDIYFDPMHTKQSKDIPKWYRVFNERKFGHAEGRPETVKEAIGEKEVVIIDDHATTGGTIKAFIAELEKAGVTNIKATRAYKGSYRRTVGLAHRKTLASLLEKDFTPQESKKLINSLTDNESYDLITLLKRVEGKKNEKEITENIRGLLDRLPDRPLGSTSQQGRDARGHAYEGDKSSEQPRKKISVSPDIPAKEVRPKLVLKPTEPTPYEKVAELEKQGIVKRPERVSKKAVIPEGGIKTGAPGKQKGLFGPGKGESLDLFDKVRYSHQETAIKGKGVSPIFLEKVVSRTTKNWENPPDSIEVFKTLQDAINKYPQIKTDALFDAEAGRAKGIFLTNKTGERITCLIAENIKNLKDAQFVLAEEMAHDGIVQATKGVLNSKTGKPLIDSILNDIWLDHSKDVQKIADRYGIDTKTKAGRDNAADEWLAKGIANDSLPKRIWLRLVGVIRAWLRKLFPKLKFTTNEIKDLAKRSIIKGKPDVVGEVAPGVRYAYAGKKALTAEKSKLADAVKMEQKGIDAEEIRQDTGWFLGMDNNWRFEIDDSGAKLKNRKEWLEGVNYPYETGVEGFGVKLSDIIEHDPLFNAYPQLKNIRVGVGHRSKGGASYDESSNIIHIGEEELAIPVSEGWEGNIKKILLHELQHAIQSIEGFARGGSPKAMAQELVDNETTYLLKNNDTYADLAGHIDELYYKGESTSAYAVKTYRDQMQEIFDKHLDKKYGKDPELNLYKRLAGEIEARDVSGRAGLDIAGRKKKVPYMAEGISKEDAIVRFGEVGEQRAEGKEVYGRSGLTVDWGKTKKTADGVTHYATYKKDGSFNTWRTKADINQVQVGRLKGIKTAKEILDKRRAKIRGIRDYFHLTDTELKSITKKDIRLMDAVQFKEFIDGMKVKAEGLEEVRQARNEVIQTQIEQQLKNEDYIRRFYELPPIAKMTKGQLNEYNEILDRFQKGDEFWTPKRIKALERTKWAGAKTLREVREKMAKEFNVPLEVLEKIKVKEMDRFLYDTAFARKNPLYNFMVDQVNTARLKYDAKYFSLRNKLYDLSNKALKSRRRGLVKRLVPQQKNIMEYVEAETAEKKIELARDLTKEELDLANFLNSFYETARKHLIANEDLKSTRFGDNNYIFHSKRPVSEMIVDIKDISFKKTVQEFLKRWKLDETGFRILDSKTGEVLSMKKFFRQTLFRTGELTPSKNIIKSTDIYMQQFLKKMALDEAVPTIETAVMAIRPKETTKTGIFLNDSLMTLTKEWLNNKKGRTINVGYHQGGLIDASIRFVNQLVTLMYIAGNIPLQVASTVGETVVRIPLMGSRKLALANTRKMTKQGRKILKEYKSFTGEGPIQQIVQPARNIGENINTVLYGIFKWMRKNTLQDLILGNMTKAEFKAGKISNEKLAEIKKIAGRWVDIEGTESVIGSTSIGKSATKFRQWAIPVISTTIDDCTALLRTVSRKGDKNKRLNKQQAQELYRLVEVGALVGLASVLFGDERDRDSFLGNLKFYALRELSTITQAISGRNILTFGVVYGFLEKFGENIVLLGSLEKYKEKPGYKGVAALERQFTPAIKRQFGRSKKKKKTFKQKTYISK